MYNYINIKMEIRQVQARLRFSKIKLDFIIFQKYLPLSAIQSRTLKNIKINLINKMVYKKLITTKKYVYKSVGKTELNDDCTQIKDRAM